MSVRHPVHHHVRANVRRERRRMFVDVGLVALFLLAIGLVALVRMQNVRIAQESRLRETQIAITQERLLRERMEALASAGEDNTSDTAEVVGSTTETVPSDFPVVMEEESEVVEPTPDTYTPQRLSPPSASTPPSLGVTGFVRFEDVTVTRYQNTQLGFVMELPAGWSEVYARGTEALFASAYYPSNAVFSDVTIKSDTLWIHVVRPCTSTEATSTIFSFATSSHALIREASACIPPFLVTLGYAVPPDTATDYLGKERFLLSVGRTLYPMVSSQAPYLPIR